MEEPEVEPNGLKMSKKEFEEESDGIAELAEVLWVGLRAITDALSKQGRLLQELMELEADKVELIQCDQWVLEDKEDKKED